MPRSQGHSATDGLKTLSSCRMGEPKTKTAMANQSHAGSGGYQDTTAVEEKAGRHAVEADGDPMVKTAV